MPIFDQGYQHWSGKLSGHAWRWLAITRHGVRIGRKNRILRLYLLAAWAPALVLALMLCIWGLLERKSDLVGQLIEVMSFLQPEVVKNPRSYRVEIWTLAYHFFLLAELQLSMVMILIVGPDLISQDLRFNALPLYFSRPLRRIDYFMGKLGIIVAFLAMIMIAPAIAAYILGLLFSLDITIIRDTFGVLLASVAYGLVISVSAGLLVLALSSLSRNSRYIALFWVGIWFVSMSLSWILMGIQQDQRMQQLALKSQRLHSMRESPPGDWNPAEQQRRWQEEQRKAFMELQEEELKEAKSDWRPLVSYTENLSRIGNQLLGTRACWEKMSLLRAPELRQRFMIEHEGSQHPWQWSAFVLLGLFGMSAWILNLRVKSLDRLK